MAKSIKRIFASILTQLSLNGLNSIIGRGVVVHAGRDDMGRVRIMIMAGMAGWSTSIVLTMMTLPMVREVTTEA